MKNDQRYFLLAITAFIVFLISGCAMEPTYVPKNLSSADDATKGLIVGSIGFMGRSGLLSIDLMIRRVGDKDGVLIRFGNDDSFFPPDFKNADEKAKTFNAFLPEGDYELYDIGFNIGQSTLGVEEINSNQKFSIPIKVTKGKLTYIGQFLCETLTHKDWLGINVPYGGIYHISDQSDRDVAFVKSKNPGQANFELEKMVVDPKAYNLPFFSN